MGKLIKAEHRFPKPKRTPKGRIYASSYYDDNVFWLTHYYHDHDYNLLEKSTKVCYFRIMVIILWGLLVYHVL